MVLMDVKKTCSTIKLGEIIKQMYQADDCLITVSGIASISTFLQGLLFYSAPHDVVIWNYIVIQFQISRN